MKNTKAKEMRCMQMRAQLCKSPAHQGRPQCVRANWHQIDNKCWLPQNCSSPLKWKIIQIRHAAKWPKSFLFFLLLLSRCHQSHPVGQTPPEPLPDMCESVFFWGRSEGLGDCRELIRSYSLTQGQMEQLSGPVSR